MSESFPIWIAAGVFFGGLVVYVLFMIFLPEWVGITGKKAREAQAAHRGEEPTDDPSNDETKPKV